MSAEGIALICVFLVIAALSFAEAWCTRLGAEEEPSKTIEQVLGEMSYEQLHMKLLDANISEVCAKHYGTPEQQQFAKQCIAVVEAELKRRKARANEKGVSQTVFEEKGENQCQ